MGLFKKIPWEVWVGLGLTVLVAWWTTKQSVSAGQATAQGVIAAQAGTGPGDSSGVGQELGTLQSETLGAIGDLQRQQTSLANSIGTPNDVTAGNQSSLFGYFGAQNADVSSGLANVNTALSGVTSGLGTVQSTLGGISSQVSGVSSQVSDVSNAVAANGAALANVQQAQAGLVSNVGTIMAGQQQQLTETRNIGENLAAGQAYTFYQIPNRYAAYYTWSPTPSENAGVYQTPGASA